MPETGRGQTTDPTLPLINNQRVNHHGARLPNDFCDEFRRIATHAQAQGRPCVSPDGASRRTCPLREAHFARTANRLAGKSLKRSAA
jgi:hypothetical protein